METITLISSQQLPILSLAEIKEKYPDQWVLIVDPELDDNNEVITGKVIYNTPDKEDLYDHLDLAQDRNFALEYIGDCSNDVVLPWL